MRKAKSENYFAFNGTPVTAIFLSDRAHYAPITWASSSCATC